MTPFRNRAFSAVMLCVAGAYLLLVFWGTWSLDLSALYYAARFYGLGLHGEIYQASTDFFGHIPSPALTAMLKEQGIREAVVPYLYPPIWAYLASSLALHLSPYAFFNAFLVIQTALVFAAIPLAYRLAHPSQFPIWAWTAISCFLIVSTFPVLFAVDLNQLQITVAFLIILAFERARAGAHVSAGVALGLAAAIKVVPILFILVLAAERKWKAAWISGATSAGIAVLSLLLAGIDLHIALLDQIARLNAKLVIGDVNLGLSGLLTQLTQTGGALNEEAVMAQRFVVTDAVQWTRAVAYLVFLICLVPLFLTTRHLPDPLWPRLFGVSLLIALCGPLGWFHYLLVPLILLPGIVTVAHRYMAAVIILATFVVFSFALFDFVVIDRGLALSMGLVGTIWLVAVFVALLISSVLLSRMSVQSIPRGSSPA
ncbi:glycosyltransferase family 87 protein [Actibacterium sp. 188UL27-1]|uniref:glycosyltransferase family 87 protein n=1 Tax=Actibacterium sp. 188UL27-1 TaxID=2786961 RepID=UPI0019588070|nr:glycosyltransferase family 87 protein [Actibacterium sp. 188UL27-1]MBM7066502.1 DUF2029 domain-containing protein [Actibacterium sp. 188UL27-1]